MNADGAVRLLEALRPCADALAGWFSQNWWKLPLALSTSGRVSRSSKMLWAPARPRWITALMLVRRRIGSKISAATVM